MTDITALAGKARDAFDRIEEAYEFMLAYAAQGRKREVEEGGGESQIRQYLRRFHAALDSLDEVLAEGFGPAEGAPFVARFRADLETTRAVIGILLGQPSITSDMIDNTNGLIAMRAFLTDLFFVDQAVLPPR